MSDASPLAVDLAVEAGNWPDEAVLETLAARAFTAAFRELGLPPAPETELGLHFTDDAAIRTLNARWRAQDKPTNVLSFPAMPFLKRGLPPLLGDIVLASETVRREAAEESKPFENHLVHLLVHGLLHLLGHDHEEATEAEAMEAVERRVLARLAIPDPYN